MALPPLRFLDISQIQHEGEAAIVLRDTEGYVDEPLLLTPIAFFIAAQLNGENDVSDIQYQFSKSFGGALLRGEDVRRVVALLDEHGFLLTPAYLERRERVISEFAISAQRPAHLAGKSYPADTDELRAFIDTLFLHPDGPKALPRYTEAKREQVPCMIVPHIDFVRGGHSYAHGYHRMAAGRAPETVFVFGVVHAGAAIPFVLTKKHFETPFGTIEVDVEMVDRIATACSWDPFSEEIAHRTEHSIEFQAVMLGYLYGSDVRIVPVLCGPFLTARGDNASIAPEVHEFLRACDNAISATNRRVSIIAGADLAHVGQCFGDTFDIDDAVVQHVRLRDHEDLGHVVGLNPERWYQSVMKDDNERRVCGLNCIYAAVKLAEGKVSRGELVHYGYAPDPTGGIVSFANIVFA